MVVVSMPPPLMAVLSAPRLAPPTQPRNYGTFCLVSATAVPNLGKQGSAFSQPFDRGGSVPSDPQRRFAHGGHVDFGAT
jgi:hypothetical protein